MEFFFWSGSATFHTRFGCTNWWDFEIYNKILICIDIVCNTRARNVYMWMNLCTFLYTLYFWYWLCSLFKSLITVSVQCRTAIKVCFLYSNFPLKCMLDHLNVLVFQPDKFRHPTKICQLIYVLNMFYIK